VFRRFCYRSAPLGHVNTQTLRAAEPLSRRGLDRGASCRFGLLCEHHQLVTWLNERTLFAVRSKRCSSITCIIELFSAAPHADPLSVGVHPTGDRDDEKVKWIQTRLHSGRLPRGRNALSSSKPSTIAFLDSTRYGLPRNNHVFVAATTWNPSCAACFRKRISARL
jgi:hypothetical protein